MVINLAVKYSGENFSAREELIGLGYEIILDFAAKHLVTDESGLEEGKRLLTLELIETKEFRLEIFGILKAKLRGFALKMSERSSVFPELYPEKRKKKQKTVFFGSLATTEADCDSVVGEYSPLEPQDKQYEEDIDSCELMIDLENTLQPEEYILLNKRLNGEKLYDLAEQYGVSFQAIKKRLDKIRKKIKPLAEIV